MDLPILAPLVLHKLATDPDIDDAKVDANWTSLEAFSTAVVQALQNGAVYIVSASTEGGLSFTLSNGTVIGPLQFDGLPFRVMGEFIPGGDYLKGDFVTTATAWGMVKAAYTAGETFDDDVEAGHIMQLPGGGGGGAPAVARPMIQRFERLGPVSGSGQTLVGQFVVPYDCRLSSAHPVLGAMTTPIGSSGSPLDIVIKRVQPDGTSTTLDQLTFNPFNPGAMIAIDQDLNAGDGIAIIQIDGNASTGGANYTLTLQFVERA